MEKLKRLLAAINLKHFNLKWVKHAIWITALGSLFVYLNVAPPFLAVASNSMQPLFSRGDLVFSSGIEPKQIREGDVIVFNVSPVFQEKYGYPATICHRVERIQNNQGKLYFRTKGDNNGSDDPFMTPEDSVVGLEKKAVPTIGYGVMFAQSNQGKYLLGGLVFLFLFYSNTTWLSLNAKKVRSSLVGISTAEFTKSQGELDHKLTSMGQNVAESLDGFSGAMSEYAKHIASHTSAIKSLADAASHMESILAKQDAALSRPLPQTVISREPPQVSVQQPDPQPIEVTPELKAAVKLFIQDYNQKNGITTVEVTPQLRAAVWNFIQDYSKNPPSSQHNENLPRVSSTLGEQEGEQDEVEQPVRLAS